LQQDISSDALEEFRTEVYSSLYAKPSTDINGLKYRNLALLIVHSLYLPATLENYCKIC